LPGFGVPSNVFQYAYPFITTTDTLVQAGTVKEMIVVIVNGTNVLGGSFYVNSPVTGNWEDFVISDAIGYVDAHYRTIPVVSSRGIAGHSMGGFGALNLAMLHPDVFSATYSLSPGLFDENGLANSQMFSSKSMIGSFLDMRLKLGRLSEDDALSAMRRVGGDLGFTLAYGAAFSPRARLARAFPRLPVLRIQRRALS
jgi:S-formylglutathione hydrolase FrmB